MNKYGLLGKHLTHSISPEIHQMIFEYIGISGTYNLFPMSKDEIPVLINKMRTKHIKGINVTIPYKTEIIKYLDNLSEEAKYIGAVNTVCLWNDQLTGYNTDSIGFMQSLVINDIKVENKNIAVLGTGGASRAVVYVVNNMGAKIIDLYSRKPKLGQKNYDELKRGHDYDIIINTTPVGMYPDAGFSPITKKMIGNAEAVVDLIYNPLETKLLFYAKELNAKCINGMYMLVAQAVKAQEIFNSVKIENDIIIKIYDNIIGG